MRSIGSLVLVLLFVGLPVFASGSGEPEATGTDKLVEIRFLFGQDSFDPETDPTRTRIAERLGVRIIPEMGNEDDKINLIVSSGQEYDAIKATNRNLLGNLIANNAVQDLTQEVESYGTYLQQYIDDDLWSMVSARNRIYALPTEVESIVESGIMIRQDWLDELEMAQPTTPEELYSVLLAFKEQDPGNVGRDRVIPLVATGMTNTGLEFNGLAQAFGIGAAPGDFVEYDGRLVSGLELPGTREYLSYLNRLYDEGLLDADFPATTGENMDRKLGSGVAGAVLSSPWPTSGANTLHAGNPNAQLVYLNPLADDSGDQRIRRNAGMKNYLFVPPSSKKAAEVVRFANDFLDPAHYTTLVVGEAGIHHRVDAGGNYQPIFPAFDELNKGRWFFPVNVAELYLPLFAARTHKEETMGRQYDDLQTKLPMSYERVTDYAPLLPEIEQYGQVLNSYIQENLMKMVIDKNQLANYDAFLAEWRRRGGDQLTAAYNEWYAAR